MEFSAKQIAEYIQGVIVGDENATVHTFSRIRNIHITFTTHNRPLFW